MKTLLFFTDTETTGFSSTQDQILSYSLVMCDRDETILEKEIKIRLKKCIFPDAGALLVNNINPFTDDHNKDALSEYDGAHALAKTIMDYKSQGYRVVLVAYNAEFDKNMYVAMFNRSGIDFDQVFTNVFDPLPVAKLLIKEKTIKTREIKTFGNKFYESAKLEDVYNALGYSSVGIKAHNALEDTKMLRTATFKLYYLFTGKSLDEASVDLDTFTVGSLKTIVYNDGLNFIKKTIKVLKLPSQSQDSLLVLDYDIVKGKPDKIKSTLIEIKTTNIFDELDSDYKEIQGTERYYTDHQVSINDLVTAHEFKVEEKLNTHLNPSFTKIESLANKMLENKDAALSDDEIPLLSLAEEYAMARYNRGWSVEQKGQNHENEIKSLKISDDVKIELNPEGFFQVNTNGSITLTSEKKSDILEELKKLELIETGTDLYKKASNFLIAVKNFKNAKHPSRLIKEFNLKKGDVFNGSNSHHKETFKGLMTHYKTYNKEAFSELSIPNFKLNLNIFKRPGGK